MRKKWGVLTTLFVVSAIAGLVLYYPFSKYLAALKGQNVQGHFHVARAPSLLWPDDQSVEWLKDDTEKLWAKFQLGEYRIDLPFRHPSVILSPILHDHKSPESPFGLSLFTPGGEHLLKVVIHRPRLIKKTFSGAPILDYPLIQDRIKKLSESRTLFEELFSERIKAFYGSDWVRYFDGLRLIVQRDQLLPKELKNFGMIKVNGGDERAHIELNADNSSYSHEQVWMLKNAKLHSYSIHTKKDNPVAAAMRVRFLTEVEISNPPPGGGQAAYQQFQALDVDQRSSQHGLSLLVSAWSQMDYSKNIVVEMVRYLERDKSREFVLKYLYSYSFDQYGDTFARKNSNFGFRRPEEKLNALIKKEERQFLEDELDEAQKYQFKGRELGPADLFEFRLNQAKRERKRSLKRLRVD